MSAQTSSERRQSLTERYSIAIITLEEPMFREMRRALSPSFRTLLASTESQIKTLIDDPDVHGIVLDLDSIGDAAYGRPGGAAGAAADARRHDSGGHH